jgi:hypothetical protein
MTWYEIDPSEAGGFCLVLTCEIEIELHKQNQLRLCECDRGWCAIDRGNLDLDYPLV